MLAAPTDAPVAGSGHERTLGSRGGEGEGREREKIGNNPGEQLVQD